MVENYANVQGNELVAVLPLIPSAGGGGGGGDTVNYSTQVTNKPKINNVTLSGNKTGDDLGLVNDVQINGTSIKSSGVANIPIATSSVLGTVKPDASNGIGATGSGSLFVNYANDSEINSRNSRKAITPTNLDYAVRSVSPACTTLSGTTATITANTTYAHAVGSSGCVYTISTPTDTSTVYNGFVLLIDTTNSASIAFSTDGSPATTISISGNPTIQTGKKYTVTGQYSPLANEWQLFIISYDT